MPLAMQGRPSVDPGPDWVPAQVRTYLAHVTLGRSIRSLAREAGCHASTVLRQVRRFEMRRDDLLVDLALRRLEGVAARPDRRAATPGGIKVVILTRKPEDLAVPNDEQLKEAAPRILRRLNEPGACLAIAADMEKAVVVREEKDGQTLRTAVVDRALAEAMVLKDWIAPQGEGRIQRYRITQAGRMALKRLLAEEEALRAGMGEGMDPYSEQHRDWARRNADDQPNKKRGIRYNAAESPMTALARRKDRDGQPFLTADLVAAGERLREDFELAQMGPRVTQNWERFLEGGARGSFNPGGEGGGSTRARERVTAALSDLGPGLGDVVLRCCCFLEGMEAVEQRMGWSARSGKIVLRIALHRLKGHYDETSGNWSPMIG